MKQRFTMILAALVMLCGFAQAQDTRSLKLEVNGMVCAFCAQGIEKRMRALSATQDVAVDLKNGVVAVELKPGQSLDETRVRNEITEAGYDVVRMDTVPLGAAAAVAAHRRK